jgi:hypothetical protein
MPTYLNGISASVGFYTNIAVSREFSSRQEQPYSPCVRDIDSYAKNSIAVKTLLESDYAYTQSNCINVCLQKYYVEFCKCYVAEYPYWYVYADYDTITQYLVKFHKLELLIIMVCLKFELP